MLIFVVVRVVACVTSLSITTRLLLLLLCLTRVNLVSFEASRNIKLNKDVYFTFLFFFLFSFFYLLVCFFD